MSIPIFIGGTIRYSADRFLKKKFGNKEKKEISNWELAIKQSGITSEEKAIRTGLLMTAGLVAGEALMGVIVAIFIVVGINFSVFPIAPWWPGLLIWIYIVLLLAYIPIRIIINKKKYSWMI